MRTELEEISPGENSSLRLMVNPNLSDFFFWHFHPEYELVFIEGASGTRHVGDHISRFVHSDLVFIGPNIPHLSFDYGIKDPYEKMVIHLKPEFLQYALQSTPELKSIHKLFVQSQFAISFGEKTKSLISPRIKQLHNLSPFEQFIELLNIFEILANSDDRVLLHDQPVENQYTQKDQERLTRIYALVEK